MPLLLLVGFLVVPILELYVILRVGNLIGALPTVVLLLAVSVVGAWIVKREGRRAWQALRDALETGRLPSRELADGALMLIGGTLLLTPGFLTDIAGFVFVLPVSRPLVRRLLAVLLSSRLLARTPLGRAVRAGRGGRSGHPTSTAREGSGRVVPGQVVDDSPADRES
ncbi:MAG: FxsA family protein [Carbonactinosporaceae bacterium]